MTEQLRDGLADLADEVEFVDLRDRALATSRRLTIRRRVVVATAGVAVVAAFVAGTAAVQSTALRPPTVPPGSGSPTSSSTPAPSASPPRPVVMTLGPWTSTPRESLPGTTILRFFEKVGAGELYQQQVYRFSGGVEQFAAVGPPMPLANCPLNGPGVSPDGRFIATTVGQGPGADESFFAEASLHVTDLVSGHTWVVTRGIGCWASWGADSSSLVVSTPQGECQRVEVSTGTLVALEGPCAYLQFAPGGAFRVSHPTVEDANGVVVAQLPSTLPGDDSGAGVEAFGISSDGRLVALGRGNTEPRRNRVSGWLYDTVAERFIDVDELLGPGHAGERLEHVVFLDNGGMVVETRAVDFFRWYVLSGLGTVTATLLDAPGGISQGSFSYVP